MRESLRRDRQIGATITSGFGWFAALLPLGFGFGLFFDPPAVDVIVVFAFLVAASAWLIWRKPLLAAGWFVIWAIAVVLRPIGVLIGPGAIACLTFMASAMMAFEAGRQPKVERRIS